MPLMMNVDGAAALRVPRTGPHAYFDLQTIHLFARLVFRNLQIAWIQDQTVNNKCAASVSIVTI